MKRPRKPLRWLVALLLVAIAVVVAWPFVLGLFGAPLFREQWGGEVQVGRISWAFGSTVVLHGVHGPPSGGEGVPQLDLERIELQFEGAPPFEDVGRLLSAEFVGVEARWSEQRTAAIERISYRSEPEGEHVTIDGLDGSLFPPHAEDWVRLVERILAAPCIAGDSEGDASEGSGPGVRDIRVRDSRVDLMLSLGDEPPQKIPFERFEAVILPTARKELRIERVDAVVFGGAVHANGTVDWSAGPIDWQTQVNLSRFDLRRFGEGVEWIAASSSGLVTGFADLSAGKGGRAEGAGWLEGRDVALWEEDVPARIVEQIGVRPERDDLLREVRASLMLDEKLWFRELIALGDPVNLYGNGCMTLRPAELELGFVPRFTERQLADDPIDEGGVGELVLDMLKGTLVEVRIEGELESLDVSVRPLPTVTEAMQPFLDLFR